MAARLADGRRAFVKAASAQRATSCAGILLAQRRRVPPPADSASAKDNSKKYPAVDAGTGIVAVTAGGPADRAGLRPGDVIKSAGGTPTADTQALAGVLAAAGPGDQITLSVVRGAQDLTVKLTLGELPGN